MAKAIDVANFLVFMAQNESEPDYLTNMRLQKLLYYCQGWSLALRAVPLFPERIEAWAHGPVVPDVYREFKDYKGHVLNFETEEVPDWELADEEVDHIASVWLSYKNHSASSLREITHRETPWIKTRNGIGPLDRCEEEIPVPLMKRYFDRKAEEDDE